MNHPKIFSMAVVAILLGTLAYASKIQRLELAKLPARAEVIALAKVLKVEEKSLDSRVPTPYDEVTVMVASVLKGSIKQGEIKVILQPRGVKGFDPVLKVGDIGVFFLREVSESEAKLAYWGSVAVFQRLNFAVSEKPQEQQFRENHTDWISEELDGLRISISQVKLPEQNDNDKPRFNVALQNVGKKDLVLNLGIMLANGKEQYSTAVKLIFTDPNGKSCEFHNNIGRHPGIAGRLDPFIVPLAAGGTYVLRADFDNYWSVSPVGVPVPLPKGRYRVAAVFNGKAVTFKQTGVYTQDLYWNGVIKSKKILFENPCTAPAYQKPGSIAFEEPKKLAPPRGHTNWISECINRTEYIYPGKTRAELLKVYTTEGGQSTRLWRRYVYRQCPYIKVDVEFKAIDDDRYEKPSDVITKISKPFLEWSICD